MFQLINPRAVELDLLVDEMTEYYNKLENQKLHNLKEVSIYNNYRGACFTTARSVVRIMQDLCFTRNLSPN